MFRKKYEFKPDRTRSGTFSKLYLTKKQRRTLYRWLLISAMLVALSLVQDVILSRVSIGGATFDLVPCGILVCCLLLDADAAAVFSVTAATLYYCAGNAPGTFCIVLLTALGTLLCIFRRSYLKSGFFSSFLCSGVGVIAYELAVFLLGVFFGNTHWGRFGTFALCGGLSVAVIPVLYPVFRAIGNIGGDSWKD